MAANYKRDARYHGDEKLIISMDIGTTQSAVSFCHLFPEEFPAIRVVTKWPGQQNSAGDGKVPSLVAYQDGAARFFGAEAVEYKDDEDYETACWFKLQLHPDTMKTSDLPPAYGSRPNTMSLFEVPPLPNQVDLRMVYSDFIRYLYIHTRNFFIQSTPNGHDIWNRLQSRSVIVFCHPNGWDISQQSFLSDCAIQAGIISREEVDSRTGFVTEGEASVHYAFAHVSPRSWLQPGLMVVVVDAGGSTVDSNLYECESADPLKLNEVHRSECVQTGGVFVDRAARELIQEKLVNSARFGNEEMINLITDEFERKTKRFFGGEFSSNVIHFGRNSDNDREHGIIKGRMTLTTKEIEITFDDPVNRTIDSVLKLIGEYQVPHLLLVGGFGDSPHLRERLSQGFTLFGTEVVTLEQSSTKAAVDGGIIWYLQHMISARAVRFPIGVEWGIPYNPNFKEHRERASLAKKWPDGFKRIYRFEELIGKSTVLDEGWEYQKLSYSFWKTFPGTIGEHSTTLLTWEGEGTTGWITDIQGNRLKGVRELCTVKADLKDLACTITERSDGRGGTHWRLKWIVVIRFGATKMQACIRWKYQGKIYEGPATILPGRVY